MNHWQSGVWHPHKPLLPLFLGSKESNREHPSTLMTYSSVMRPFCTFANFLCAAACVRVGFACFAFSVVTPSWLTFFGLQSLWLRREIDADVNPV